MCGICGFVGQTFRAEDPVALGRMNAAIQRRGPDDSGFYLNGVGALKDPLQATLNDRALAVGLAMRRLAIIDLEGGAQPMSDGRYWIVFNGEIYNFESERAALLAQGYEFKTRCDTEVVLLLYRHYGPECLKRLRGMFAVAIWDSYEESLFLARDHFGIKPLFYTQHNGRLIFGSEIKSLLRHPGVYRQLDTEALPDLLSFLYVPAPRTLFHGIFQLQPGEFMLWKNGEVRLHRYWPDPLAVEEQPLGTDDVLEGLRESVEAHLISDVQVGAFLSGGIDSSLIVALARQITGKSFPTFSISFPGSGMYDESAHARAVAKHVGTDHFEHPVQSDSVENLPKILRFLDEPLANASVMPNYELAQFAAQTCKVCLSGIGGDEFFGGYRRYIAHNYARPWQMIPRWLRNWVMLPLLRKLPAGGASKWQDRLRLLDKFLTPLDLPREQRYIAWNSHFSEPEKNRLLLNPPSHPSYEKFMPFFQEAAALPFGEQVMHVDVRSYLPGDSLFLCDRLTMGASLEARVPFADLKMFDLSRRVALGLKTQGTRTKAVLRDACAKLLPQDIIDRPKQGFGTPVDLWLRNELAFLPGQLLDKKVIVERQLFRPELVERLVRQQKAGGRDVSQHLWILLTLELWQRMYIDTDLSEREDVTFSDLGLKR
ncbi:MAG: asparagine synthase (glutamine-hydrolyzing) [Candidatus Eremiobacteraeota bacterium]|nr:asparagine synthase (glutamine-hydrolyzing) [Candidatus Eremiobacteraeota bacterium]